MMTEPQLDPENEKQRAASSSVAAAVLLTAIKLVVGLLTGSLGILSEAAHSGLDLVAALVTFFSVRFSDRPPDPEHHYGHGKIENLSALVETLLLLITCGWIVYEAIQRLFFETVEVEASIWSFVVMGTSVVVDINRSRMLYRVAKEHNSQALEADALHFSTDIWSSLTVIGGLALVWLSGRLGPEWEWLVKADAVAALAVAVIVVVVSLQLGKRAVGVLLDSAPPGLADRITTEVARVSGVEHVGPVRVRPSGADTFVDLTVSMSRSASLEEAHQAAVEVEARVASLIGRGDIVVHVDPIPESGEILPQTVSAIAGRLGIQVHNVHVHEVRGAYYLDFHLEMPPEMTLDRAHQETLRLEAALREELPQVREIGTHIEPFTEAVVRDVAMERRTRDELQEKVLTIVGEMDEPCRCHRIRIWHVRDGYDVVLTCQADAELSVAAAHRIAIRIRKRLQSELPQIHQVLVDLEPEA